MITLNFFAVCPPEFELRNTLNLQQPLSISMDSAGYQLFYSSCSHIIARLASVCAIFQCDHRTTATLSAVTLRPHLHEYF